MMNKWALLLTSSVMALAMTAGCGTGSGTGSSTGNGGSAAKAPNKDTIVVGSKNFTESLVLGEIYADALEHAGFKVQRKLNLGGTLVAQEALKTGQIDLYPEYTGTGLLDILKLPTQTDSKAVYQTVKNEYKHKWNLDWLDASPANDSQGIVITKDVEQKYHITNLSDMAKVASNLRFAAVPEFTSRADGLPGLQKLYGGFQFKSMKLYDYGVKYRVLLNGDVDGTVCFTTDGQLTNPKLFVVPDDKHLWPPYNVAPVVRDKIAVNDPKVVSVLNQLAPKITSQVLQQLNAKVDIQKQDYQKVAHDWLVSEGLI
jgi:osmoprotectant transport system substrate-binding protein